MSNLNRTSEPTWCLVVKLNAHYAMHVRYKLADRFSRDRTHGLEYEVYYLLRVCNKSYRDNPAALGVIKDELTPTWNKSRYLCPERLNPEHRAKHNGHVWLLQAKYAR